MNYKWLRFDDTLKQNVYEFTPTNRWFVGGIQEVPSFEVYRANREDFFIEQNVRKYTSHWDTFQLLRYGALEYLIHPTGNLENLTIKMLDIFELIDEDVMAINCLAWVHPSAVSARTHAMKVNSVEAISYRDFYARFVRPPHDL